MTEQGEVRHSDTQSLEGRWARPDELQKLVSRQRILRNGDRVRSIVDDGLFISVGLEGLTRNVVSSNRPGVLTIAYVSWDNDTESKVTADTLEVWVPAGQLAVED